MAKKRHRHLNLNTPGRKNLRPKVECSTGTGIKEPQLSSVTSRIFYWEKVKKLWSIGWETRWCYLYREILGRVLYHPCAHEAGSAIKPQEKHQNITHNPAEAHCAVVLWPTWVGHDWCFSWRSCPTSRSFSPLSQRLASIASDILSTWCRASIYQTGQKVLRAWSAWPLAFYTVYTICSNPAVRILDRLQSTNQPFADIMKTRVLPKGLYLSSLLLLISPFSFLSLFLFSFYAYDLLTAPAMPPSCKCPEAYNLFSSQRPQPSPLWCHHDSQNQVGTRGGRKSSRSESSRGVSQTP